VRVGIHTGLLQFHQTWTLCMHLSAGNEHRQVRIALLEWLPDVCALGGAVYLANLPLPRRTFLLYRDDM
jgi:hypothetical protein